MKKVGKMPTLHARISDRGVTMELDESAVELILPEGYSAEYGARNLERVMDRLLGQRLANYLLAADRGQLGLIRASADQSGLLFHQGQRV